MMSTNTNVPVELGKSAEEFRNYKDSDRQQLVENHYRMMRENQCVESVDRMYEKWMKFGRAEWTVKEAFEHLADFVDSSDPDSDMPNIVHMFQTAESIRKAGHPDWFQLVGLLHDLGKMQYLWGTESDGQNGSAEGAQWALGGDTWIVGCRIPDCTVFPEFNMLNKDMHDSRYNTEYGIYEPNCGIMDSCKFAWGHDEYMYQMLVFNNTTIPEEGLAMIRLHSLYPWHDKGAYTHLMNEKDYGLMPWIQTFNKFDLYTKADDMPDIEDLWPYYQELIDKYLPGKLKW